MSHIFEELPFYLPDAECPFFFTLCLDLLTYAKQTNHQETKKNKEKKQKTENVINSDLILGLKGDLANKTNALTKGERLKTASDNEKH